MFESKKEKIQRGWHKWFAWYPVNTLGDERFAWLKTVERKYYQKRNRRVVKKDLNESQLVSFKSVEVMHRPIGSSAEQTIYMSEGGAIWRDSKEVVRNIPNSQWDWIRRVLDSVNDSSLLEEYVRRSTPKSWEFKYIEENVKKS